MHWKIPALLVAALILAGFSYLASAGEGKDKGGDKKALQGTWTAAKGDQNMELIFEAKNFSLSFKGKKMTGTYTIDPSKKPNQLDMTIIDGGSDGDTKKFKGKTSKAIYEIAGNKLKWLAPEPGNEERPTVFPKAGEKTKAMFLTFERKKAAQDKESSIESDRKALQGTWKTDKDNKAGLKSITFDGEKFVAVGKNDESMTGTYTIDPTQKPKTIDLKVTSATKQEVEDKFKGKSSLGVYEFDGENLRWCASTPGEDNRPKDFKAGKHVLIVFEREKK